MKARYFSPSSKDTTTNQSDESDVNLLRVGSVSKIPASKPSWYQTKQRVGKYTYQVNKIIGQGYSSKVYRGYLTDNAQDQCAIKAISLKDYRPSDLQLLENQISILQDLDHPNIIELYEVIRTKSCCYIITEYCPGDDLMVYLLRRGRLEEEEALSIFRDITEGYKHLVKNNVIHRDLKPANILRGKFGWKIADFGFAIRGQVEIKSKNNVGTPLYMPPQSLVKNIYSVKTDLFSIGIILNEMLTGRAPWESKTQKQLLRKMLNHQFSIPTMYGLTEQIQNLLCKLCNVDVKKRMDRDQFMKMSVCNIYNESLLHRGNITQTEDQSQSLVLSSSLNLQALISPRNRAQMLMVSLQLLPNTEGEGFKKKNSVVQDDIDRDKNKGEDFSKQAAIYNNRILVNQLHYCRFIYYLIKNSSLFLIGQQLKTSLSLLGYQHLMKLIKQLSDMSMNWFHLKDWDSFVKTKRYSTTNFTLKEYLKRYQREYNIYCKFINVDRLKQGLKMPTCQSISMDEYCCIKTRLTEIIRVYKDNMEKQLIKIGIRKQLKGEIQGITSIIKYRKLIQISLSNYQNFDYFQKHSDIHVQNDYKNTTTATKASYQMLKKDLIFL